MMEQNQRFEALSRICLNNWHYIDKKVMSFSQGVNFFTGHSGSGKSTVIDAMQIVLYADTDGRSFFNKAASDDSNRTLIEYLRGMVNIGENGESRYLRNRNFSTTIVLEFLQTDTGDRQCIGTVFDVDTACNEIVSRLFFWHEGEMPEHYYRILGRAMSVEEIKGYLQQNYRKEQHYIGSSNERFRKQLYDVYLGGLDEKRFPLLFKRAIPFRMNIKLEDFVKEYICMEEDIQIEDMQESVMQYGRMRKKIWDTCEEIRELEELQASFHELEELEQKQKRYRYFMDFMEIGRLKDQLSKLQIKMEQYILDGQKQQEEMRQLEQEISGLEQKKRELDRQIASSGYEDLKVRLDDLDEIVGRLDASRSKWDAVFTGLKSWEDQDITPNPVLWDIERFGSYELSEEELKRLKKSIEELRKEVQAGRREAEARLRELGKQRNEVQTELAGLKQGNKSYPRVLEEARRYISEGLFKRTGKWVPVEILADLLDIPDDAWRNAVEGYMGSNKLLLIVEPKYARQAMELYQELDEKKYASVSVLDTEKVMQKIHGVKKGALSEEVQSAKEEVRAYIDFMMGNVVKCRDIDELRGQSIGITSDCMLYKGYRLQRINHDQYTKHAYIGKGGMKKRIRRLEEEHNELSERMIPLSEEKEACELILGLEALNYPIEEYLSWMSDMKNLPEKEKERKKLIKKLKVLREKDIAEWESELEVTLKALSVKHGLRDSLLRNMNNLDHAVESCRQNYLAQTEALSENERNLPDDEALRQAAEEYLAQKKAQNKAVNYEALRVHLKGKVSGAEMELENGWSSVLELRLKYLKKRPNRTFSADRRDNREYDELLEHLKCADLKAYYKKADEQAQSASQLFKEDFIYKIRFAIQNALQMRDELNKIIAKRSFGKDRYQFKITRNKGAFGKYYDMFMDENLEINPAFLKTNMDNQENLFTMSHEERYGELLDELISIFIPPDHATKEELEEAKRSMDLYADYRTYLSFEMEQIIEGEDTMKIPLSRMIKKNSGGEGQNPLYVALLASFAQAYRINRAASQRRNPTIRLVVLDEAFSKMDAEKVGSCIKLIRSFGFQALISATNDKIQNYLESVDKTFVFANPNKKQISIQEFERADFGQLTSEAEEE